MTTPYCALRRGGGGPGEGRWIPSPEIAKKCPHLQPVSDYNRGPLGSQIFGSIQGFFEIIN